MSRSDVLSEAELQAIDAWWRAANYLSVGQIYLMGNPLLREPLRPEHVKPRLLGHWGTTPGLNFIYAHLNRAIAARDLDTMYLMGPGHGGPGPVAAAWLEGTYSEVYPEISQDAAGMRRLFTQFSFPGGIPSHVAPETPARSTRAASSATCSPTPTARRSTTPTWWSPRWSATARRRPVRWPRAGTRTSSSTPPATAPSCRSCTSTATRSPIPRCWPGSARDELQDLFRGYGYTPHLVEGSDPVAMHQAFAATLDRCLDEIAEHPAAGPGRGQHRAAALADDRAALAQGLDRPQGGRRGARRGLVALAPGAVHERAGGRRPPGGAGGVAAQLPARGAVRRVRGAGAPPCGTCTRPGRAG